VAEPGLAWLLLDAFRSIDRETQAALLDRGISELRPSHARAMLFIDRSGTRLGELASRAQVTKQAMMQLVDELAELGLVRRVPDVTDSRAKVVKLTARGLRERAEARRAIAAVEARARRRVGRRRIDALKLALVELASEEE
jgi:DNA-binding MarR family transcriptional regulator